MIVEAAFLGAAMLVSGAIVRSYERSRTEILTVGLEMDLLVANVDATEAQNAELMAEARALVAEHAAAEAHQQAVEAHGAVSIVSARLAQAHQDLELAEGDLALAHVEGAQLRLALLLLAAESVRRAATIQELRIELELAEENFALADQRADVAEHDARAWESRARNLGAALEERCGPAIVEPSDVVVLFRGPGQGFGGFA